MHGDYYYVGAFQDFSDKQSKVRVFQVKEIVRPTKITLPLKAMQALLEDVSPGEEEVLQGDGVEPGSKLKGEPRSYKGSSRPECIDSGTWKKLQYHDRVQIADF